jgi:hypothetical protein
MTLPLYVEAVMKLPISGLVGVVACGAVGLAYAADAPQPNRLAISNEANAAIQQMGKTLAQENISFNARTLRVYQDSDGDYLHIVHKINVAARRPDKLAVTATGDDGTTKLVYDGKDVNALNADANKYVQLPVTGNVEHMLDELQERVGVEFPLADLMSTNPAESFLAGVTSGKEVDTDKIDGVPCRHLFFTQSGATELELWVENNDRAVPRRLIITYRALPGTPNFVAEFSDWNFERPASDAVFVFQPPTGAQKVDVATLERERGTSTGSTSTPTGRNR